MKKPLCEIMHAKVSQICAGQGQPLKAFKFILYNFTLQLDEAIDIYREFSRFPEIKLGRICNRDAPGHIRVYSEWTQRDLERKEKVTFGRSHIVQLDLVFPTPPQEIANE